MKTVVGLIASILLLSACTNSNQSALEVETNQKEQVVSTPIEPQILFENDHAKVVKVSLAPEEFQAPHEGEKRVIYSLTDYSIDWEENGENLGTKTWKEGDVHFHDAGKHAAKNNGSTNAEWLVFVRKNSELPVCADNTSEKNVSAVAPELVKTLLDNEYFGLIEITLPKGDSIPSHSGANRIVYSLSDYEINYQSDNGHRGTKKFKTGDVHWHEACSHALSNNGESEAKFLVVSYK